MIYNASSRLLLQNGTPLLLNGCGCDALILQSGIEVDTRYMKPSYITYEMVASQIHPLIKVQLVDDPELPGMYIGLVNEFLAQGESYIIQTVLSNYVEIPLTTTEGCSFESLITHPKYKQLTYIPIINLFKASGLYQIYLNYFSMGGEGANGQELIAQQAKQVNFYTSMLLRLDQSGNLMYKNAFDGLRKCRNASQRIAKKIGAPNMISGSRIADFALGSIPDLSRNPWGRL